MLLCISRFTLKAVVSDLASAVAAATFIDSGAVQAVADMAHTLEDRLNDMALSMTSQLERVSSVCCTTANLKLAIV